MGDNMKIATSILASNDRITSIKLLNNTDTDYIHIDVMDNKFVPNLQLSINEVNQLNKYTKKPFDIHLMVENPFKYIENINLSNTTCITIHIEIEKDIEKLIKLIKSKKLEVGLAIKPNTNLELIDKYINKIDKIIVMSVEPGFGGQKFIENSIERIKEIRKKRKDIIIEVDGGINIETVNKVKNLVDIAVVGSYITNSDDYNKAINNLKN